MKVRQDTVQLRELAQLLNQDELHLRDSAAFSLEDVAAVQEKVELGHTRGTQN